VTWVLWNLLLVLLEIVYFWCVIGAWFAHTYHRLRNCFGSTRWYSWVTRLKWKLVSVRLETVLVSVQARCTVCAKCTTASKIRLDVVLILIQDRGTVCAERTVGLEIILDAPVGTPR
jgi:hypothetical protein